MDENASVTTAKGFLKKIFGGLSFCDLMSQSIPTGYIPPGNPQKLAQKTFPGGQDLTFEVAWGREFDKDHDFVENESETSKNSVDQFLQVKTKKTS